MTSLPLPVHRSRSLQPISLNIGRHCPRGAVCFRIIVIFPNDFVSQYVPRGFVSPGDLELDVIFEDHGGSWLTIDEMFALDLVTCRLCVPAQPILSALQTEVRSPLA